MMHIGNTNFVVNVYVKVNSEHIQTSMMEIFVLMYLKVSICQLSVQELHLRYLDKFLIKT